MTPGQSRVAVLLLILLGLEAFRLPALRGFFHNAYNQGTTNINQSGGQQKQ